MQGDIWVHYSVTAGSYGIAADPDLHVLLSWGNTKSVTILHGSYHDSGHGLYVDHLADP